MRIYTGPLLGRLGVASLLVLLINCQGNNASSGNETKTDTAAQKKDFFPVLNFLKGEIRQVDSTPVGIKQFITKNGKTDSGYLNRQDFHRLAAEFLDPALQQDSFSANFKENAFYDKGMSISSFVYTAKNQFSSLNRVDVTTRAGASYDRVSSVYLEKSKDSAGSTILRKLYWNPGHGFQISTVVVNGNQEPENSQIKVVWDQGEY